VIGVLWVFGLNKDASDAVTTTPGVASTVKEVVIPAAPEDRTIVIASVTPTVGSRAAGESRETPASASTVEPESYVTPPLREGGARGSAPAFELASYVGAHSAVSSPMLRHSAISAVIASPQPAIVMAPASEVSR
jgi:hypothetical protein